MGFVDVVAGRCVNAHISPPEYATASSPGRTGLCLCLGTGGVLVLKEATLRDLDAPLPGVPRAQYDDCRVATRTTSDKLTGPGPKKHRHLCTIVQQQQHRHPFCSLTPRDWQLGSIIGQGASWSKQLQRWISAKGAIARFACGYYDY